MSIALKIFDRADMVRGHFCIGRMKDDRGTWEFWNEKAGWSSAGTVIVGRDAARDRMKQLEGKS
jgi:hypothetical protein